MLSFFPVPYEDEILYSVFARYHIRSGNTSFKSTINDLFGSTKITAVMDLPSNLNKLIENLPVGSKYTAEYLIYNHTLYPFYAAFLPPGRAKEVLDSMKMDKGGSIYTRIGIMASSITLNQFLKFCPACIEEDKQRYGEFYWHRIHQIPGIFVCPKHYIPIYDSQVPVRGYNKHEYKSANEDNCKVYDVINYPDKIIEKMINIAQDTEVLLNRIFEKKEIEWFKEQYFAKLMEIGFATINKSISQKELIKSFIDYYGDEFLRLVQSEVNTDSETNWLMDMLRKKNKTSHPIRHLLLARFLGISIDDLFNKKLDYKPFGYGPWPCLNKSSDHYLQPVVTDMKVTYGADVKKPIGTFKCSCGFVYSRSGPDMTEDARHKIGRIKAFGSIWEARLKELVEENLTMREVARLLGVDPNTVKKYARKLGLATYWKKGNNDDNESLVNYSKGASGNDYDKRDIYRNEWLNLLKKNPGKGKTELRQMDKALFTWLYRNDREWLNDNSPAKKRVNNGYIRVDWNSRDKEILPKVKDVVKNMLDSKDKPERISISKIGSKLGIRALLEKHLDKLPRTKAYLDSVKESDKDFRIRRIKWAIQELEKEGQELKEWRILRKAGIRKEYQENIKIELEILIGQNKYFR